MAECRDWAEVIVQVLRPVVQAQARAMDAAGVPFGTANSAIIAALLNEQAAAIAANPPRIHRDLTRIIIEELPRVMAEAAVTKQRILPEPGQ